MDLHADRKKKKMLRENRKKKGIMTNLHLPPEERNEQAIMVLNQKFDMMMKIINQHQRSMDFMGAEIMGRLNEVCLPNDLSEIIEEKEADEEYSK
mmetsp:Transcript_2445/g.2310  ORF Transcript_2445/g.2310 Transcript_2445/m.2310 type:complete len:95 (+) Transcript_2445:490-774(+)